MPHIHLETTADLAENANVPDILEALVQVFRQQDTVDGATVKAYHTLRSNWAVGPGHKLGFAHVTLKLLTGRSLELRQSIAQAVMVEFRRAFADSIAAGEVALTLDVVEMTRETYLRA